MNTEKTKSVKLLQLRLQTHIMNSSGYNASKEEYNSLLKKVLDLHEKNNTNTTPTVSDHS